MITLIDQDFLVLWRSDEEETSFVVTLGQGYVT